jgi:iron-sulfur cluster assembly protein
VISLTQSAIDQLRPYGSIRLGVRGGGCSGFQYDMEVATTVDPAWEKFEFEGVAIYVDQMSLIYISDLELDWVSDIFNPRFEFNNPAVTHTCGCGKSVSL